MSTLGGNVLRVDGPAKIRGSAQYTGDIELPGMVYAKVLRSTYPHARLLRVDASKAEKLPGVVAVLTRDDFTGKKSSFGSVVKDQGIVAIDRVRYVGDVIAAVAAEERDIAEEALDLIEVQYEPLAGVFDPIEAMKPHAPILHEDRAKAQSFPSKSGFRLENAGNVLSVYHVEEGDVGVGFSESDEIFEDEYSSPKIQHAHIEPHSVLAYWEPQGNWSLQRDTEPSAVRAQLAELFDLPQSKVRVIVPFVGRRLWRENPPPFGAATRRSGAQGASASSVGVDAGRGFSHGSLPGRGGEDQDRGQERRHDRRPSGRRRLRHGRLRDDIGRRRRRNGGEVSGGPYRIRTGSHDVLRVHQHAADGSVSRVRRAPGMLGVRVQMDDIARRLGIDPLELRLKNMVHEGDTFVTGDKLISVGLSTVSSRSRGGADGRERRSRRRELPGKVRGKGLAVMIKTTMTPSNSVGAGAAQRRRLGRYCSPAASRSARGRRLSLAQIVAAELGLPPERVSVTFPDTDVTPFDQSTSSSRTVFTWAARRGRRRTRFASSSSRSAPRVLEANVEDLQLVDGFFEVKGVPESAGVSRSFFGALRFGRRKYGWELRQSDNRRGGPADGKGKRVSVSFHVGLRGGSGSRHGDGKSGGVADGLGGGCGQSGQSAAVPSAERRIDDHVAGFGAVRGDGVRQRAADQLDFFRVHAAFDGRSSPGVPVIVGGDAHIPTDPLAPRESERLVSGLWSRDRQCGGERVGGSTI